VEDTVNPPRGADLAVDALAVRFGGLRAVDGVSLRVDPGEVVGLIGPNGAGKTTLFNAVSGQVRVCGGRVVLDGRDVTRLAPWRRAGLGVARTFQHGGLVPDASVAANVAMAQHTTMRTGAVRGILGLARAEEDDLRRRATETLRRLGLGSVADLAVGGLSQGLQKRVQVACAVVRRPRLLLLDEPSAGLDPAETADLATRLVELQAEIGCSVLVIDHDLRLVRHLARRVVVLSNGGVLAEGTWEEIRSDPAVVAAYLGPGTELERGRPGGTVAAGVGVTVGGREDTRV
jgi:ABC-type branched-subunit amino acid transport system ATPase component